MGFIAQAIVAEAIALSFRGGPADDDKDGEYLDDWIMSLFVYGTLRNATAMIPGAGQVINSGIARTNNNPTDDRVSLSPVVSALEGSAGIAQDLYKTAVGNGNARQTVRDVATLISITTGLPASAAARPVGYGASIAQGKVDPTSLADLTRGLISGSPSPESKQQ
jgi:hypothetical protein